MTLLAGLDIGGTKCSVVVARPRTAGAPVILAHSRFPTPANPALTVAALTSELERLLATVPEPSRASLAAIGISCGGPLDAARGHVLGPPNLPGWDDVDVVGPFARRFGVPTVLENDANAGALAEWRWGAGRGHSHLVFLTFGTGMGAGLILNGRLYRGASGSAGEVGHMRLSAEGPSGFGKAGSFEGFCSGGGIARLAIAEAQAWRTAGRFTELTPYGVALTAEDVGRAAARGDALALAIWETVGRRLGQGLAVLLDVLNPEVIVLGGIYRRQAHLLEPVMRRVLASEALPAALEACRILPAELGEEVGAMASLAIALEAQDQSVG
jgi:glucokinase